MAHPETLVGGHFFCSCVVPVGISCFVGVSGIVGTDTASVWLPVRWADTGSAAVLCLFRSGIVGDREVA